MKQFLRVISVIETYVCGYIYIIKNKKNWIYIYIYNSFYFIFLFYLLFFIDFLIYLIIII